MGTKCDSTIKICLTGLNLEKYIFLFEENMVNMELFLSMNEEDLRFLGIEDDKDLELLLKYIKLFKPKDKVDLTNSIEYQEIENTMEDVSNQLKRLRVGMQYVHEFMNKNNSSDFIMNENTAASYMEMMLNHIQEECNEFTNDLNSLVKVPEFQIQNKPCSSTPIHLLTIIAVCVVILSSILVYLSN